MRLARPIRNGLEAVVLGGLALVLRVLPRALVVALGRWGGAIFGRLDRGHRAVAARNLEAALGEDLDEAGRREVLRRTWRHFGRTAAEGLILPRYGLDDVGTLVTYEGWEHVEQAYQRGKGVLCFTGHFGNWELVGHLQAVRGRPLDLVTRPLDNPFLERLLAARRTASGNRILHKQTAVRGILGSLREGRGVAIVIDQNVRSGSRVFVPFFGRLAATTPTLALLALRTGVPVIPAFALPGPGCRYHMVYLPEVVPTRTGDRDRDVLALTARCTEIIEDQIRRHPDCWLWMHDRWKSRPRAGEPGAAGVEVASG